LLQPDISLVVSQALCAIAAAVTSNESFLVQLTSQENTQWTTKDDEDIQWNWFQI